MNIVVTGINGFVGKHLAQVLVDDGHSVIGIGRENKPHDFVADKLTEYTGCNLVERWPAIKTSVDAIIHLAGLAAVGPSFDNPQTYINQNSAMVTNLCEYYLMQDHKARIIIVSSGAVYDSSQPMPITENSPVAYGSPYAVSKILNENQAAYYKSRGLECVVMRPFNHIGPNQMPGFIVPDLAKKITNRASENEPISAGNLASNRDYTDVRDVAKAYRLVATSEDSPKHLIYNVCSGKSRSGNEVLFEIAKSLNVSEPKVNIDQSLVRPNDSSDIYGSSDRLTTEFGWSRDFTFEQSIKDFITNA